MTRAPVDMQGRMAMAGRETWGGWALFCDKCGERSEIRPGQKDLPLQPFREAGWFIAEMWGDRCPTCRAEGIDR